jgi:aspartate kinase
MIVMKFGGSSIANADHIRNVVDIIKLYLDARPLIVFSASGKTTDNLIQAGNEAVNGKVSFEEIYQHHITLCRDLNVPENNIDELLKELEHLLSGMALLRAIVPRSSDYLVSFGERLSVRIIAAYMNAKGIPTKFFDAWDIGFLTDSQFTCAEILPESMQLIHNSLKEFKTSYPYTPLITGFIARDRDGAITTFGRGGSDLTASLLGSALKVDEIQVWKDVDGILTADPRIVAHAQPVECISFEQASELAYFGAKVLHPVSIIPAMSEGIPVTVKNSYNPKHPGTKIVIKVPEEDNWVKSITYKKHVTLIHIVSTRMLGQYGFLACVFQIFANLKISVDVVATSEVSIALTLDKAHHLDELITELQKIARVTVSNDKSIVSLIGDIQHSTEILSRTMKVLKQHTIHVQMISHGASKVNNSFIVNDSDVEVFVKDLHKLFFETPGAEA